MDANKIQLNTLILSVLTVLSVELAVFVIPSKGLSQSLLVLGAARLLQMLLIVVIVLIWGKGLSSIGLERQTLIPGLKKGLTWSAAFGLLASLALVLVRIAGVNPLPLLQAQLPQNPMKIVLFFLVGALAGPIAEEVFFRGVIYGFLRRWGLVVALVLSTLLFVVAHPFNRGLPVTRIVGGLLFAVAYEVEGSLLVPITIHCLGNGAIFGLSLLG